MTNPLSVSIIQSNLQWENIDENLKHFTDKINTSIEETDLIILPEMFSTGFTMNSSNIAEDNNGKAIHWMKEISQKKKTAITGSIVFKEEGSYYNRLIWIDDHGQLSYYNKRHLFTMGNEHEFYSKGNSRTIVEYKGWKILPLICYDLRFPVWSRNTEGYDLLIYVANWPERRSHAWRTLLPARAIENQCYVAGVNRVGKDGKGIQYSGDSGVYDFMGSIVCNAGANQEETITVTLDKTILEKYRKEFPVLNDSDQFNIML